MPPKRRSHKDLPPNLYPGDARDGVTRYRYRDPRSGKWHGMGSDKAAAIADAKALNAILLQSRSRVAAITVQTADTPKLSSVILKHLEICEQRAERGKLAANTIRTKRSHCNAISKALGDKPIGEVGVRDIADLLAGYVGQGKERAAQSVRSEAIEIWKTAISEGYVSDNVPAKTRTVDVEVRRERLTLDDYLLIREAANGLEPWVGLSMDLALVSGQRREDIASMQFKPAKDASAWVEDGSLWVIQAKTGNRVSIPFSLRLDAVGLELGEVVNRCRDRVVSRFLIHHRVNKCTTKAGGPVWKDTISRAFQKARELAGLEYEHPPTFHELRSLSARLYAEQGLDPQALLGHKDARMTAVYRDSRGSEWVTVKVGGL